MSDWCKVGEDSKPGSPITLYCMAPSVRSLRFRWPIPGGAIEVDVCEEHHAVLSRTVRLPASRPAFVRMPDVVPPPRRGGEGLASYAARVHMWRTWLLDEPRPDTWYSGDDAVNDYKRWRDTDPVGRYERGERGAS
jgi:hypothetical protein